MLICWLELELDKDLTDPDELMPAVVLVVDFDFKVELVVPEADEEG